MEKIEVTLDIECYPNYFLVMFKGVKSGVVRFFERTFDRALPDTALRNILSTYRIITFNGNGYDMPMLMLAMTGATCQQLKEASDWLIVGNNPGWKFYDQYALNRPDWVDHIDLSEVAFGQGSLKLYGGRLHSRKLQDLPLDPDTVVTEKQMDDLRIYCENDHDTTIDLYNHLRPQIELRERMSVEYGQDLRSKSDAQIAEAVITRMVTKALGYMPQRPGVNCGTSFTYKAPAFIKYRTPHLQGLLDELRTARFVISDTGSPLLPPALDGRVITIGSGRYRMGIGGLHSSEEKSAHFTDDENVLIDRDVTSYYPAIILNCGLYPDQFGESFLRIYKELVARRIAAKKHGDDVVASSLKIVINSGFGLFGSQYSRLYSPNLMIQVTVTGQLSLLMLIESLELHGIPVVSANTDGIVIKAPRSKLDALGHCIREWESATGFATEETRYKALYSRDVNNYVAVKAKGGTKGKGLFADVSIAKNPQNTICVRAVKALLDKGVPLAQTILSSRDIREFVTVRTVRGGAVKITRTNYDDRLTPGKKRDVLFANGWYQITPWPLTQAKFDLIPDGCGYDIETAYRMHCGEDEFQYVGKVIRYYYAVGETGALHYMAKNKSGNRNKVPSSDGAKPLMELPDEFPSDVDYGRYIEEATQMLRDLGALRG